MNCAHCGGTLTLEDMTKPNCPFCHNVLKHHAQAAEHAVLVNKIMADRFNAQYPGIPPGQIPQIGHQFGAPMNASFDHFAAHQTGQALKRAGMITIIAVVIPIVAALLIGGVAIALWLVRM